MPHHPANTGLALALAHLRGGRIEAASALCQNWLKLAPKDPALHQLAAAIALQDARWAEAEHWAASALQLWPDHPPAALIRARAARGAGDMAKAIDWLRIVTALAPRQPEPWFELALLELELGESAAPITIEHCLEHFPGFAAGWRDVGLALWKAGQIDAATLALARAAQGSPAVEHSRSYGAILQAQGRHRDAIAQFHKVLEVEPGSQESITALAQSLRLAGDLAEAREVLERLIAMHPNAAAAYFQLGLVCDDQRDVTGAIVAYRACVKLRPDWPEAHVNLGLALQQAGDFDDAMGSYRRAARLRPDTFGRIAQALPAAQKGQLHLNLSRLRGLLISDAPAAGAKLAPIDARD